MSFGYSCLPRYIFGEVKLKLKRAFLFQLFVILFVAIFCALGTWQLYRLQWKLELISEITLGLKSSPIQYSNAIKKNYQRVNARGKFNFDKQIYLYSLNNNGKPGYDVITPFTTNNNENVLVNRGWIKKEFKKKLKMNSSSSKIKGLLREKSRKNIFTPKNDLKKNIWFSINLNEIEKITGKKFKKYIVYLEDEKTEVPKPKKITIDLPNNHLKYAITWYSISISILFYFLYFRKKQ